MARPFSNLSFDAPFIVQHAGSRSLHFTLGETQSSMRLDQPDDLHLDYTRTMMGFLLLQPQPRNITMVGLGGGSLVKFSRRYLPSAVMTVVENNPGVIALRKDFGIPDDNAGLRVITDDGAAHVAAAAAIDVLLVDGFDSNGQPPQLCSQDFYDDCFSALAAGGVLVVNLHPDNPQHDLFCRRIAQSFGGNAMQVMAAEQSNCVVFAARRRPVTLQVLRSREAVAQLDPQLRSRMCREFARIGWNACQLS